MQVAVLFVGDLRDGARRGAARRQDAQPVRVVDAVEDAARARAARATPPAPQLGSLRLAKATQSPWFLNPNCCQPPFLHWFLEVGTGCAS